MYDCDFSNYSLVFKHFLASMIFSGKQIEREKKKTINNTNTQRQSRTHNFTYILVIEPTVNDSNDLPMVEKIYVEKSVVKSRN